MQVARPSRRLKGFEHHGKRVRHVRSQIHRTSVRQTLML